MDRETEQRSYPRDSIHPQHETEDANRFAEVVSPETHGGTAHMPGATNREHKALQVEIAAYQQQAAQLEASHLGKWVVFKGTALIAVYDTFEAAAEDAVERFGRGPFLIRQVGAPPIVMPISVAYNPAHEEQP